MKIKKTSYGFCIGLTMLFLLVSTAGAYEIMIGGKPLRVIGYLTQNAQFSLNDKSYPDFERGLNGALTNVLLETAYQPTDNTKLFVSGMFSMDWIYDIKSNESAWNDKGFAKSRRYLYMDNQDWQLLKEAHFTWTPPNGLVRVGKQVVVWGETDGVRIMDQINPLDQRRVLADVELETSRIPIWLVRLGYSQKNKPTWLQDLGYDFVFNPNVEFIRNQPVGPGNDVSGIWAPYVVAGPNMRVGSITKSIDKVNAFSSDGFEYAARVRAVIYDAIVSLNYYYGLDKDPVLKNAPVAPTFTTDDDGARLVHPTQVGKYPLFRYVGATFSRDITSVKADFLGGVSPTIRWEGFYAFNNTFLNAKNYFEQHDEIRWAGAVDWKFKVPFLNPTNYFSITGQFYHRKILDYPKYAGAIYGLANNVYENNYTTLMMLQTSYWHNRITPQVVWQHDHNNLADMFRFQLTYQPNNEWRYVGAAILVSGNKNGAGLNPMEHKDYMFLKVVRTFN
ncbi:MAG: hypothetical protein PHU49_02455 [Syntrophorhabdaceae bacterium]|nr:hypothetical protein [Syntrophorhabdaceae bacterium]MDD5242856.1 hypothetical protein [Syntrophorhabdaceae bacterium]